MSISLKHFRRETQCFSDWAKADLKRFGQLVEKLFSMSMQQLMRNSRLCDRHGVQRKPDRFGRPSDVAADAAFYELELDLRNTCRIHGVFEGSVFASFTSMRTTRHSSSSARCSDL